MFSASLGQYIYIMSSESVICSADNTVRKVLEVIPAFPHLTFKNRYLCS